MIKMSVRGLKIQYASRKKKSDENKIQVLERKLQSLNDEINNEQTNTKIILDNPIE